MTAPMTDLWDLRPDIDFERVCATLRPFYSSASRLQQAIQSSGVGICYETARRIATGKTKSPDWSHGLALVKLFRETFPHDPLPVRVQA